MNLDQITALFSSKNPKAKLLGFVVCVIFLFPSIARAMDDETLSVWQRAEMIVGGIGQVFGAIALTALKPEEFIDSDRPTHLPPK